MKKKIDWLLGHGVGLAAGVFISVGLAVAAVVLMVVVFVAHWWDKVR